MRQFSQLAPDIQAQFVLADGASDDQIAILAAYAARHLPDATVPTNYLDFVRHGNGATGRGPNLSITLHPVEDVPAATSACASAKLMPGLLIIGNDGRGNHLGIDCRSDAGDARFLWLSEQCFDWDDVVQASRTLSDLLEYLDDYYQNLPQDV